MPLGTYVSLDGREPYGEWRRWKLPDGQTVYLLIVNDEIIYAFALGSLPETSWGSL